MIRNLTCQSIVHVCWDLRVQCRLSCNPYLHLKLVKQACPQHDRLVSNICFETISKRSPSLVHICRQGIMVMKYCVLHFKAFRSSSFWYVCLSCGKQSWGQSQSGHFDQMGSSSLLRIAPAILTSWAERPLSAWCSRVMICSKRLLFRSYHIFKSARYVPI